MCELGLFKIFGIVWYSANLICLFFVGYIEGALVFHWKLSEDVVWHGLVCWYCVDILPCKILDS